MTAEKSLLPAIHAQRRKTPGLAGEADWRGFLQRVAGKASLRAMTPAQHKRVLAQLLPKGKPHFGKSRYSPSAQMGKIRAEWLKILALGGAADGSEAALAAFIARCAGQDIGRLPVEAAQALIERLKAWRKRLEAEKPS